MKLRETKPVLICIDLQLGFQDEDRWGGNRKNKDAEEVCAKIIAHWRSHNEKIIHVRHSSNDINSKLHASNNGFRFNPLCKPIKDESVITKSVNSCFIGTNLRNTLDQMNYNRAEMLLEKNKIRHKTQVAEVMPEHILAKG